MNKHGEILIENIIFIVLNLIFLTILVLFLLRQGEGAVVLEENYAKEIALMIDSAKPIMTLRIDMADAKEVAEKNGIDFKEVVKIEKNIVIVKLTKDSGYSYSFFNDVDVSEPYPVANEDDYIIFIGGYKNE
ncbi:MAG: hypothetical protein ABFQ65_04515 [Nanoarchaeota archaeon]